MQTYPFKVDGNALTATFNTNANLFVYESASGQNDVGAEVRIVVKPDHGAEIVLRPGQRFRLGDAQRANTWTLRAYADGTAIDGFIILGSGEFDDANTKNVFTLDATFANTVKVTNTDAERVPVGLDPAVRVPVALDPNQMLQIAPTDTTMAYTGSYADSTPSTATAVKLIDPATNVNGAFVEFAQFQYRGGSGASCTIALVAKATAPATVLDGDVLLTLLGGSAQNEDAMAPKRIRIAPGKGLWMNKAFGGSSTTALMNVLYTVQ